MEKKSRRNIFKDQKGFTLIEIIAVLIVLGILAAVAIPKYMGVTEQARDKAAQGQIAEAKGRLSQALARYMLANGGTKPADGAALVDAANDYKKDSCPDTAKTEGDFKFICKGGVTSSQTVTITVSEVQEKSVNIAGVFIFADE